MISKGMMDQHMKGRSAIKLPQLVQSRQSHLEDENIDWVTFGVIVHKSATKSAANGGSYMIWKISDLDNHSISVFLFREAYNAHWKESEGAMVAVLNAKVLPAREEFGAFSLSVSEAGEVAKVGLAMDYGTCKATRKDGAPCSMVVNKLKCQYCEFHVGAQLKAINQSSRLELQGTKRGECIVGV
jgi:minichromosome maintenance protein 10